VGFDISRARTPFALVTVVAIFNACSSPTMPDSRIPQAVGQPTRLVFSPRCDYGSVTTCHATAEWGLFPYSSSRDVTSSSSWSSDPAGIVQILGPGVLVAGPQTGDAMVTASYEGRTVMTVFRVYAGEPTPWELVLTNLRVRDTGSQPIPGATVTGIGGHNNGVTAVTDQNGFAELRDIACGPMTVRISKAGYVDSVASWFMCRDNVPSPTLAKQS
jgi:hypothetical protein